MNADDRLIRQAADAVAAADALLIGAGAGMGVDSGLPDFRGAQGFWNAYPVYEKLGLNFMAMANPRWFATDRELAWGFYGHRLNLYRTAEPHAGFKVLLRWSARVPHGAFVFTSNVDGHFQKAGFDTERVYEVHGSIAWAQCASGCADLFPTDAVCVEVDETTMRAAPPLPACPSCGALARPNILMFGDMQWDPSRANEQETRLGKWLKRIGDGRLVVIECGAGTAVPTVRHFCERLIATHDATLVRINVREPEVPPGHVGIPLGALEALRAIDTRLS